MHLAHSHRKLRGFLRFRRTTITGVCLWFILTSPAATPAAAFHQTATTAAAQTKTQVLPPGMLLPPDQLAHLLPETVYFQGRTAPLQLRNAAGTTFGHGAMLWVALVDASGYATGIQERYQFYLVPEGPVRVGETQLSAGAYGGGFVGDRFLIMDLGGHTVAEGPAVADTVLARPRPLQFLPDTPSSVKLYLGRRWVTLRGAPNGPR